mgnify:FL=1|jgi:hypothetical protein
MQACLSVNHIIDQIHTLDGMPVEIEGILGAESERYYLLHYPQAERKDRLSLQGYDHYFSAIGLSFGRGSIQPNFKVLNRWIGKRVRVHGKVQSTLLEGHELLFDWLGLVTPVCLEPYSIQRLTAQQRRQI